MTFVYSKTYLKHYRKLPEAIRKKMKRQLKHLATYGVVHPGLSARKMTGVEAIWEARVDEHYRFTFQMQNDVVVLRKVGTHEIYRKP